MGMALAVQVPTPTCMGQEQWQPRVGSKFPLAAKERTVHLDYRRVPDRIGIPGVPGVVIEGTEGGNGGYG